ncbi:MAG: desulfoferrodoxin [Lentisphaeria bacterium]|nr:desulfoferrodoxin [Lentisphaeria bacterium]
MKTRDIYRCKTCKLQMEATSVVNAQIPVCCGSPMELQQPNTVDAAKEKHVPVIVAEANGTRVKVGSVAHPATPEHFIEWIELFSGNHCCRVYLTPSDAPEAFFAIPFSADLQARISCNLHGVWLDR